MYTLYINEVKNYIWNFVFQQQQKISRKLNENKKKILSYRVRKRYWPPSPKKFLSLKMTENDISCHFESFLGGGNFWGEGGQYRYRTLYLGRRLLWKFVSILVGVIRYLYQNFFWNLSSKYFEREHFNIYFIKKLLHRIFLHISNKEKKETFTPKGYDQ